MRRSFAAYPTRLNRGYLRECEGTTFSHTPLWGGAYSFFGVAEKTICPTRMGWYAPACMSCRFARGACRMGTLVEPCPDREIEGRKPFKLPPERLQLLQTLYACLPNCHKQHPTHPDSTITRNPIIPYNPYIACTEYKNSGRMLTIYTRIAYNKPKEWE
jgi:hypothetical protein